VTAGLVAGLAAALGSALALNWGYWAQHGAASTMPPLSLRRPLGSLRLLFTHRRWTAGFLVGIGGWVLYVVALWPAPLSIVQAVSAGGIGVLGLLAWRFGSTRPPRRELSAVGLALFGLLLLAVSLMHGQTAGTRGAVVPIAAWVAGSGLAALAVVAAARRLRAGAAFGIAAGLLYAAGDVATKAAVGGGPRLGFVAVLLACHGFAFVVLQLGFQRGDVLATAGLASLFTNAAPIAAGVVLYGESLPPGWAGIARIAAFAAVVAGGAGLARGGGGVEGGYTPSDEPHSGSSSMPTASATLLM
jgi:hypothetical protein